MTIPTSSIEQVIPGQGSMAQPEAGKPARTKRQRFLFLSNRKAATGLVILGIYILLAIIGPWIAPFDPGARGDDLMQGPSGEHWMGTTHLGQDVYSQLLVGTRSVIFVGFLAGIVATILSVIIGVTAGYVGGKTDEGLSALSNVFLVIPALPLYLKMRPLTGAACVVFDLIELIRRAPLAGPRQHATSTWSYWPV